MDELDKYEGIHCTIVFCKGAKESLDEVLAKHAPQPMKSKKLKAQMWSLLARLADGHRMTKENFPTEGDLPDGSKFHAIKKIPLRAYLWRSKKYSGKYFISHFIYKDFQKLKPKDTTKVCNNWREIEEGDGL
ncbi:hypothetical protein [Endozoicomonas sp. SCSIO W0465]|uniref:hypothetical protein n=1 Tax=Endozoicomonas sp. SCSIO W0465 TaxID=2918516 RepID=UPI002074E9D2|nr:hypothetical protein [Endozoicomonas sp. SCSIO W0465]USE34104.1 hypothetical protein MJO57_18245 [Endozoicomonas sp. SCSIO W0465]